MGAIKDANAIFDRKNTYYIIPFHRLYDGTRKGINFGIQFQHDSKEVVDITLSQN